MKKTEIIDIIRYPCQNVTEETRAWKRIAGDVTSMMKLHASILTATASDIHGQTGIERKIGEVDFQVFFGKSKCMDEAIDSYRRSLVRFAIAEVAGLLFGVDVPHNVVRQAVHLVSSPLSHTGKTLRFSLVFERIGWEVDAYNGRLELELR
jgi:hypothetical protein